MTKAITVINEVSEILQDEPPIAHTEVQLLRRLNDAQRNIINVRPDVNSATVSFKCQAGTRQDLPITDIRLIRVTRNMGELGTTPGDTINYVDAAVKDRFSRKWHSQGGQVVVKEYTYDPIANPHVFYVDPPIPATPDVFIEIVKALAPIVITNANNDDIELRDTYIPIIHEWMLYKSYARDSEETPNYQRAILHFNNFYAMLGAKLPADIAVSPRQQEQQA